MQLGRPQVNTSFRPIACNQLRSCIHYVASLRSLGLRHPDSGVDHRLRTTLDRLGACPPLPTLTFFCTFVQPRSTDAFAYPAVSYWHPTGTAKTVNPRRTSYLPWGRSAIRASRLCRTAVIRAASPVQATMVVRPSNLIRQHSPDADRLVRATSERSGLRPTVGHYGAVSTLQTQHISNPCGQIRKTLKKLQRLRRARRRTLR